MIINNNALNYREHISLLQSDDTVMTSVPQCIFNKRYLNNLSYINKFSEKIKLRQSKTIIPNLPKTLEGIN